MSWKKRHSIRHAGLYKGYKSVEAPEANANGTSGYLIKEGKNAGKVLKHLKTEKNKL